MTTTLRNLMAWVLIGLAGLSGCGGDPGGPPALLSVLPARGPSTGGIELLLEGRGFQPGAAVHIDGHEATSVQALSPTQLRATLPASPGAWGAVSVVVLNPDGSRLQQDDVFSYYAGQVQFPSPPIVPIGRYPRGIATGDLNMDGHSDVIVGELASRSVRVLLGDGKGSFLSSRAYDNEGVPTGIAVVDWNSDQRPDVIISNGNPAALSILLGDGLGGLTPATRVAVVDASGAMAVADFNRDGALDIAVATGNGFGQVFYGNGHGGIVTATSFGASYVAGTDLVAADLDGDGWCDLLVNGQLFLNDHRGTFPSRNRPSPFPSFRRLVADDFNRDGKLDVAIAIREFYSLRDFVQVWHGDGQGGFALAGALYLSTRIDSLAVGDVSGDGWPDLLAGGETESSVFVLLGSQAGRLTLGSILTLPASLLAVTDLNHDGLPDVVAGDRTLQVRTSFGAGVFADLPAVPIGPKALAAATGDLDGDGKPDLASVKIGGELLLQRGDGAGGFSTWDSLHTEGIAKALAVVDFNHDARPDLVVAANAPSGLLNLLQGDGSGGFVATSSLRAEGPLDALATADLNRDGYVDLVVSHGDLGAVSVFLSDGSGGYLQPSRYPANARPTSLAVGDVNGDSLPDVVVGNTWLFGSVSVLLGDGRGKLGFPRDHDLGQQLFAVLLSDCNGDGRLDVVATGPDRVSVLSADGAGGLAKLSEYPLANLSFPILTTDINGDGAPDLVVSASPGIRVLLGDGHGGFGAELSISLALTPQALAVSDYNLDGRPDLLSVTPDFVYLLENLSR